MDETYSKLLAEIESLKSQISELRMAQANADEAGGSGGAVGSMLVPIGQLGGPEPDNVSIEHVPDAPSGTTPDGDEGQLQIKNWKDATAAVDQNTIAEYLTGTSSNYQVLVRAPQVGGKPLLGYVPIGSIWSSGSGGVAPEVTYLDDVTWDSSNHQLVKQWVKKNLVTGVETPVQGAPQGKTATISTTAISSIIGS